MSLLAPAEAPQPSALSSRRGGAILGVLCLVQFMDVLDASILNIALPSVKHSLGFTQQSLQWVVSGYTLTYGGFLLLGGRLADSLGRRRVLISGLLVFAGSSLVGGLAHSAALLVGARFAQGLGAALLSSGALSTLTSTFRSAADRPKALGAWAAVSGLGGAVGVLLGGVLTEGPGWRWVLFVNLPFAAVALVGALILLKRERGHAEHKSFDASGAALVTGGMLLLIYALVKAPEVGWGATRTTVELGLAGAVLVAFVLNELRASDPLVPWSILRINGVAAADTTQMLAIAGFFSMFFFLTLYMQTVLRYSPIQTGVAYLPMTAAIFVASGAASKLLLKIGPRALMVVGCVIATAGLLWLARVPVHGAYVQDILPGVVITPFGIGVAFVGGASAANAGIKEEDSGLAAGLLNTAQQLGAAVGLAILSALATARTHDLLHSGHTNGLAAATSGYHVALIAGAGFAMAGALVASLTRAVHQLSTADAEAGRAAPAGRLV
jgi:EmrB/QacA subfamily drug resistance transporter